MINGIMQEEMVTLLESAHGGQADMLYNEPRVSSLAINAQGRELLFYASLQCIFTNE